jgi:hypothetical protein
MKKNKLDHASSKYGKRSGENHLKESGKVGNPGPDKGIILK